MDYGGTFVRTRILLVDDDEVCLQIVSGMLKIWRYEVATVTHPMEALTILRLRQFDLILSDYHMPDMSGIELQQRVEEEFKLPVIIMSSDDRKNRICTSLQGGALFYLMKPIKPDVLKNVWQYAIVKNKEAAIVVEESNNGAGKTSSSLPGKRASHDHDIVSASSSVDDCKSSNSKENSKRRVGSKILKIYEEHPPAPRKAKIVWTNSLHDRFLQAINIISLDKAVPKRILEVMNVPGLSRENIASHLQKYRLFLKRVAENGSLKFKNSEKALKSNFASNVLPSLSPENQYSRPFQPGSGKFPSFSHGENPSFLQYPDLETTRRSSTLPRVGFERSNPLHGISSTVNSLYGGKNFHYDQSSGLSSSIQIPASNLGLNILLQGQGNSMYSHSKDHLPPLDISRHMNQSQQSGTMPSLGFNSSISGFNNNNELALSANEGISSIVNSVIRPEDLSSNPPVNNYVGFNLTSNAELVGGGGQSKFNDFGINNINGVENNNRSEFDLENLQSMLSNGYEIGLPTMALEQQFVTNQGTNHNINNSNNLQFDTMNGPSIQNDNNTNYQQPLGEGDHSNVFGQQVDQPYMNCQNLVQHPDITNGSYIADYENNVPPNDLLLSDFPNLYHVQDNNIPPGDPFAPQQYNGNGHQMETNNGMTGLIRNDGFSSSGHRPEQQQQGNGEQLLDSILPPLNQSIVEQMAPQENAITNNQHWEHDAFIDSLIGAMHEFLGD